MAKTSTISNLKLGVFVIAGLSFLVLLLYMIGKNQNLFGANFLLKARFANVQGLMTGNNVRFAGIEIGTVKRINILADTAIEVEMTVQNKMRQYIHKNAVVSIGTDGFVGNKVVNITPSREPSALVKEGDVLASRRPLDTDDMLQVLSRTNKDIGDVVEGLKSTVARINSSTALWQLLNDNAIPQHLRASLANVQHATAKINVAADDVESLLADVKSGKGSLGAVIKDTAIAYHLNEALVKINNVGAQTDSLSNLINEMVKDVQYDLKEGKGIAHTILKDTVVVNRLNNTLYNIEQGTASFNDNMDALKHSFLLRGYFRKQNKQRKQNSSNSMSVASDLYR